MKDAAGNPVTEKNVTQSQTLPGTCSSESDQNAGHERRWVLNANSAHPFENPTPLSNFWKCWPFPDPGRPLLYLRQDGGRHPSGLGDPCRHDLALRRFFSPWRSTRSFKENRLRRWGWIKRSRPVSPAATWRARRALRHRQFGPVRHRNHRRFLWCGKQHA